MIISSTGVNAYMGCARKFKYTRIDQWEYAGPVTPGAMELGSMVHHLVEQRIKGMPVEDMPAEADGYIIDTYDNDFSRSTAKLEHYAYALAMTNYVVAWLEHNNFFDKWEIVTQEERFEVDIDGYTFTFKPDLLLKHKVIGHYGLLDFKTSQNLQNTFHAGDWQMTSMAVGLAELGMNPYWAAHLKVKKVKTGAAKPPYVDLHEARYSEERIKLARAELVQVFDRITNDPLYLPSPDWTCSSMCAYKAACEAQSSGHDWEYVMLQTHRRRDKENNE